MKIRYIASHIKGGHMGGSLSQSDIQRFEKMLQAKLAQVVERETELQDSLLQIPDGPDERVLATDMGAESLSKDVGLRVAKHEIRDIQEMEDALTRIKENRFGVCEDCEDEIPIRRLEVLPEARYCVKCEEEAERDYDSHAKSRVDVDFGHPIVPKRSKN